MNQNQETYIDLADFDLIKNNNWHAHKDGNTWYVRSNTGGKSTLLHRLILNPPKNMQVDHINRNGLDNRRSNIRIVTPAQNSMNSGKYKPGTSIHKGVYFDKSRRNKHWSAQIGYQGKHLHIGRFYTEEEAAMAYNDKAIEYFGEEYAYLNEIKPNAQTKVAKPLFSLKLRTIAGEKVSHILQYIQLLYRKFNVLKVPKVYIHTLWG